MKQITSVLICCYFCLSQSQAQLVHGTYSGSFNGISIVVKSDTNAILSYRYETTISFEFECRIVKKTDSTFQLENVTMTSDKITADNKKRGRNGPLEVKFFSVNRAKQNTPVEIDYEILSCSTSSKLLCICFFYNHRFYCYTFIREEKLLKIYVDAENSFLIKNWKIRNNMIIPYINGKEVEKWIVTKK